MRREESLACWETDQPRRPEDCWRLSEVTLSQWTEGLNVFEQPSREEIDKALGCVIGLGDLGESLFRGWREGTFSQKGLGCQESCRWRGREGLFLR